MSEIYRTYNEMEMKVASSSGKRLVCRNSYMDEIYGGFFEQK